MRSMRKPSCPLPRTVLGTAILGLLCACEEAGIRSYRAPKQQARATHAESLSVVWTTPQGWESVSSDQPMRLATFLPGAGLPEVSVTAFPGDSGGMLANINRWRNQLGLGPIDEAELLRTVEMGTVEGVKVGTVDIAGANGQQMLGAVIVPGDGKTWFVKATGAPDVIATLKPVFRAFALSFRLKGGAVAAEPEAGGEVHDRLAHWTAPSHWRADPSASSMVAAAYDASNADGGARITATVLLNDGGGLLANINRWREQIGLPPFEKLEQQPKTDLGRGNLMVDLTAADGVRRIMAAIVTSQGETWFFKITGSVKGIEAERSMFEKLVRNVGLGEQTP